MEGVGIDVKLECCLLEQITLFLEQLSKSHKQGHLYVQLKTEGGDDEESILRDEGDALKVLDSDFVEVAEH